MRQCITSLLAGFLCLSVFTAKTQCITNVSLDGTTEKFVTDTNKTAINFTVGSGNNRLLVVMVATEGREPVSVKLDTVDLTLLTSVENGMFDLTSSLWYMVDPPSGAHSVTVDATGANSTFSVGIYSFANAEPTRPFRTIVAEEVDDVDSDIPMVQDIKSSSGDYILDIYNVRVSSAGGYIAGPAQTTLFENVQSLRRHVSTYRTGNDGDVPMMHTFGRSTSMGAYIGVSVNCRMEVSVNEMEDHVICNNEPDSVVIGGDPTAIGGTLPYTYSWAPALGLDSTTVANPKALPSATTTYTVTVTDSTGTTATGSVVVIRNDPPANPDAGEDTTICEGLSAQLQASGGTSYQWSPSGSLSNSGIANPVASPTTTTTYVVSVSNELGCTSTDTVVVNVNPAPPANAGADTVICDGGAAQLKASGGTIYIWSPGSSLSDSAIINPVASPEVTTVYTVTVTDSIGCQATDQVTVSVTIANAGEDEAVCEGKSVRLSASGGVSYRWSAIDSISDTTAQRPYVWPTQTTTYTVTVTGSTGCSSVDSVVVTVNPKPVIEITDDTTICKGESIQLNATGGVDYEWSPNQNLTDEDIANPLADPASTIHYVVEVITDKGCVDTAGVTITVVEPSIVVDVNPTDTSICGGQPVQLQVITAGSPIEWTPSTALSCTDCPNPVASPNQSTTYTVYVDDPLTICKVSKQVTVTVQPTTAVNAGMDVIICKGASKQLSASASGVSPTYSWSPATGLSCTNCYNPVATPTETTTYTVTASSQGSSCSGTDEIVITVDQCQSIDEVDGLDQLEIYPNPFRDDAIVNYELSGTVNVKVTLYDGVGKQVAILVNEKQGTGQYRIDLRGDEFGTHAGIYLLKFTIDGKDTYQKLIRTK